MLFFTAKEPSRIRLYKTLSQVLAGKLNGSYGFKNDTFIVSTKPEAISKPKSMASKRITTEAEMSPELKKLFKEVAQAKDINSAARIIGIEGKITVSDSNRAEKTSSNA